MHSGSPVLEIRLFLYVCYAYLPQKAMIPGHTLIGDARLATKYLVEVDVPEVCALTVDTHRR
jgi:hypothetical protein